MDLARRLGLGELAHRVPAHTLRVLAGGRTRCSSGVVMSATSTAVSLSLVPFSSTKASVAKTNGSVRAGSPHGVKSEAIAPNSIAASTAQPTASTPDRHVSTKNTPPTASAASNELNPQRPL